MSRKSMEIQFVFINICKKRNHILICWKWVSTAKQIQHKYLNIYGILFFGLDFMGLIYHYSALNFAVFIWNMGMKVSKSARNSKFLKCENYHISDFGLIHFTGLCLDAICSSLGNTDYEFSLPHSMKESICHYAFETSKLHLHGLVRNIDSLVMLANQTKKCF